LCVNFLTQTGYAQCNDSVDDLERLDAANLHREMHYLLLSIPHSNLTGDLKKIDSEVGTTIKKYVFIIDLLDIAPQALLI
jgi:hypothetical protein